MNLALFGAPGSGKSTQASMLTRRFGLTHLSTGDRLRAERRAGTDLGREVEEVMSRGELVSDAIVERIVEGAIRESFDGGQGVLFDGYPRNVSQLENLESLLESLESRVDLSLNLEIDKALLLDRLTSRRVCGDCQRVFNLVFQPPSREGVCEACGGQLQHRSDDRPEAVGRRLEEYRRQTEPLLARLKNGGRLRDISAAGSIDEIQSRLVDAVEDMNGTAWSD